MAATLQTHIFNGTPGLCMYISIYDKKRMHFQVITGIATSHYSGKIFQKLGFNLLTETSYDDYRVDGVVVFPPTEPHTHVKLFLKNN